MDDIKKREKKKEPEVNLLLCFAIVAAVVAVIVISVVISFRRENQRVQRVQNVEAAIMQIGKVSLDSLQEIEYAETLLEALPEEDRVRVSNVDVLTESRAQYDKVKNLADETADAINSLPETVTLEDGERIKAARKLYKTLKSQKAEKSVSGIYKKLTYAEEQYKRCQGEALLEEGRQLYEQGEYLKAAKTCDSVIKSYPELKQKAKSIAADSLSAAAQAKYSDGDLAGTVSLIDQMRGKYSLTDAAREMEEQIQQKLNKSRPRNGHVVKNKIPKSHCELVLSAGDQDVYVKVENAGNPEKYALVYVRADQSKTLKMVAGNYRIKVTSGKYWFGEEEMFGPDAKYKQMEENVVLETSCPGVTIYYSHVTLYLDRIYDSVNGVKTILKSRF